MMSALVTAGLFGASALHVAGLPSDPNPLHYYATRPYNVFRPAISATPGSLVLKLR